jgi:(p)ppGpp synthase/HD superfamily hydrolase
MVDVYGFRIIVDNADTCYRVLGLVHSVYKPMPGRFKDYIAIPRVNGYQSLHTTLFGPNGVPIEAQIRSEQMHRVAESGIAAHWKYKSGGDSFGGVEHDRAREWLASLVQIQEGGSSEEFLESVKVDLFPDKVYVFTPKGRISPTPYTRTSATVASPPRWIGDWCRCEHRYATGRPSRSSRRKARRRIRLGRASWSLPRPAPPSAPT